MQQPKKQFCEYRNETKDPFVKLFYDILSRYHKDDYDIAIAGMSPTLRDIIVACNERLQIQRESSELLSLISDVSSSLDDYVIFIFDRKANRETYLQFLPTK